MLDGARTTENNIVSWITGKSDLQQVSLQELKDITHQYPYFTLAQLLLTVKMKKENDPEYQHQLQKTALNFQNPQWLHFQLESLELSLRENESKTEEPVATAEDILDEPKASTKLSENLWEETQAESANEAEIEEVSSDFVDEKSTEQPETIEEELPIAESFHEEETVAEPVVSSNIAEEAIEEKNSEPETPTEEGNSEDISENNSEEEHISTENNEEEEIIAEAPIEESILETDNQEHLPNIEDESNTVEHFHLEIAEPLAEEKVEGENTEPETSTKSEPSNDFAENISQEEPIVVKDIELEPTEETPIEEPILVAENHEPPSNAEQSNPTEESPTDTVEEKSLESDNESNKDDDATSSRLSSMLEAQAIAFKTVDVSNKSLDYDNPVLLPTKDYFASIGITTDNTLNTDFGQKVKRFSDWLKQMKRVGTNQIEKQVDPNEDKIIMQKADDSNKSSSILTETMVEVLVQQGKKQEAIDILGKLSLLKPEKSSYFASLINNLKSNN